MMNPVISAHLCSSVADLPFRSRAISPRSRRCRGCPSPSPLQPRIHWTYTIHPRGFHPDQTFALSSVWHRTCPERLSGGKEPNGHFCLGPRGFSPISWLLITDC